MTGDKPNEPAVAPAIEPIQIAMVGTIGTGSGTGTGAGHPITDGTVITTPDHMPNIVARVITPLAAILIRFANAYVTALIGLVTVGLTSDALPASDFAHLVIRCAGLSLAGPGVALMKDLVTILGNLEKKYPLLTGNV